jgi:hypothetical protein
MLGRILGTAEAGAILWRDAGCEPDDPAAMLELEAALLPGHDG